MLELQSQIDQNKGDTKVMKDLNKTNKPKDFLKKLREAGNIKIKSKDPCDKIQWLDPYVLNTRIETEWQYNIDR